jgi:aerobic-type carbon monoxide dehydrogenase small subunit (CoxS/CutS family)
MAVAFTINGKAASVETDANTPLLWVVREHLKLTGTKFGCGSGLCGACTVHLDGKAVRACQTTMSEVAGKQVTTIEGLSPDSSHALQKAWIAEQVPQCGYCQPARSCRPPNCWRSASGRRGPRSSPTWTATSAAAEPIRASCGRSSALHGRAEA